MLIALLTLVAGLVAILIASDLFTNALEHIGARLGISEGVTGSIFAAIGTALPETCIPLVALLAGTSSVAVNEEIGVGAILGAPLMLSTLSFFLLGASLIGQRGWAGALKPEQSGLVRDLNFFVAAFAVAAAALWMPAEPRTLRWIASAVLCATYLWYLVVTVRASAALVDAGHGTEADEPLWAARLGLRAHWPAMLAQLFVSLVILLGGAKAFIGGIEALARWLGTSTLLVSVLVIPVATELPEKVNSITWARRQRDTLGVANITGALVFQGTLLPAIGILLTPWMPRHEVLYGVFATLAAAIWLRLQLVRGRLSLIALAVNGLLYLTYLVLTLS